MLSSPMGLIFRSDGSTFPLAYTFNTVTGKIRFIAPTYIIANNAVPTDVWIYQPVNTNGLYAVYPTDVAGNPNTARFGGTSFDQENLKKTLTVTIDQWTDPGQFGVTGSGKSGTVGVFETSDTFSTPPTQLQLYAWDLWTSVADAVVEGEVTYYGFPPDSTTNPIPCMTFGTGLTIQGKDGSAPSYTTGWENLNLPIREVMVEWPQLSGQDYITRMRVSNRRDVYSADQFLKPSRRIGFSFGMLEGATNVFGGAVPSTSEASEMVQSGLLSLDINNPIDAYRQGASEPDFAGQMAPFQDFGAGIHVAPERTQAERLAEIPFAHAGSDIREGIESARLASDRAAVQKAFQQWAPPPGQSGGSESGPPSSAGEP